MITDLTATALASGLKTKQFSAVEVTQAYLDRIEATDDQLGAFLHLAPEAALEQARSAQSAIDSGSAGPLCGVPIAIKDNISTKGLPTTCASKILEGYVPPFDATVIERLKAAHIPILGKTNLDEFAMGTSTENSAFQVTRNPWDLARAPGGSSGGSAAAVAGKLAPLSLGSDTGGSIRQPASLCGVVGFKPTYGRCSRFGLVAFGSSLDQIGPFARTVQDAALLSEVMTGHDPADATSLPMPPVRVDDWHAATLKGKRIGVLQELIGEGLAPGVRAAFEATLALISAAGAIVEPVSIPSVKYGVSTYYIIAPAEASSNLARFDGIRFGPRCEAKGHVGLVERTRAELFGHEVKARIMIGTYALSAGYYDAFYTKAQTIRAIMAREFSATFEKYDFIVTPTSPVPAFKLGELKDDPLALKLLDLCTIPANMAGIPGISINCGFTDGLPVGIQLLARERHDEDLLMGAYALEQILPDEAKASAPFAVK